jgi:hypothetical protein
VLSAGNVQVYPAEEQAPLTAAATLAAIRTIHTNLPFHGDAGLTAIAHDVLLLLHYVPAPSWRLGMAACMNQQPHLQQVRQRLPKLWQELRAGAQADPQLREQLSGVLGA